MKTADKHAKSGEGTVDLGAFSARLGEILAGSALVIDHRSRAILTASQNPLEGDYRELGRMIPEKLDACTRATVAGIAAFCRFQAETWMVGRQAMTLMARGRPLGPAEFASLVLQCNNLGAFVMSSTHEMLKPIHRRVTFNARRLRRMKDKGAPD